MRVPGLLRPWVDDATVLTAEGQPFVHVPDPATSLVLRTASGPHVDVLAVGPRTRASYHAG